MTTNIVIGQLHQDKRTLVFKDGGQITSSNGEGDDTGIGIVAAKTVELLGDSEVEPPDVVVEEPDLPDIIEDEPQEESISTKNSSGNKIYAFDLGNGEILVIEAEELFKISQSESVADFVNNSSTRERKPIEIYISNISTATAHNLNLDLSSTCRVESTNFAIVGKGGIAENPLKSVIQHNTVPDLEGTLSLPTKFISSAKSNNTSSQIEPVVEATAWQINQNGKVELLAISQPTKSNLSAQLQDCLQNSRN